MSFNIGSLSPGKRNNVLNNIDSIATETSRTRVEEKENIASTAEAVSFINSIKTQVRNSICLSNMSPEKRKKRLSLMLNIPTLLTDNLSKTPDRKSINLGSFTSDLHMTLHLKRNSIAKEKEIIHKSPEIKTNKRKSILDEVDFLFTNSNVNTSARDDVIFNTTKTRKETSAERFFNKQNEKVNKTKEKVEELRKELTEIENKKLLKKPILTKNTRSIINTSFIDVKPIYKRAKEVMDAKYFKLDQLKEIYRRSERASRENSVCSFGSAKGSIKRKSSEKQKFSQTKWENWVKSKNEWKINKYLNIIAKKVENDYIETEILKENSNKRIRKNKSTEVEKNGERLFKTETEIIKIRKFIQCHLSKNVAYNISKLLKN